MMIRHVRPDDHVPAGRSRAIATLLIIAAVLAVYAWMGPLAQGQTLTSEAAAFEQDRKAILALAGEYKVRFQFEETVPLQQGYALHEPHVSEATEFIDVVADTGRFISLQHVLVLRGNDEDTGKSEARVVKHWRQDWTFEDRQLLEYAGHTTWRTRTLSAEEARGGWSQAVFQVDDSPRYESFGRWQHEGTLASWEGHRTWRPLPRREHTTRDDYHVLVSRNRHTLTPGGWVHEQDNCKLVLEDNGEQGPILCREVGLNRYDRVSGVDFTAGRDYWKKTGAYWADVRTAWQRTFAAHPTLRLRDKVEDRPMYRYFFEVARDVTQQDHYDGHDARARIEQTLAKFIVTSAAP